MKSGRSDIEDQVFRLPHRDRARIALALIESLDPGQDEDVSELWLDEAQRRISSYDAGGSNAQDAQESLSDIERQLK